MHSVQAKAGMVGALRPIERSASARLAPGRRATWAAVIALLLLGGWLRLHDLTGTPPGIDGDEMFYFLDASRVLSGDIRPFYPTNFGHEPVFVFAQAASVQLLGGHAFSLRYTAVVGGLLSLALAFGLARRLFNARVALLTLALYATLFWPVFMTRVGLRAFTFPLLAMFSAYTFWRALEAHSWRWSVTAGLAAGLTLYTYTSSRVWPGVVVLWLAALLSLDRQRLQGNWGRLSLILALAALTAAPLAAFAWRNPGVFSARLDTMGGPYFEVQRGEFSGLIKNSLRVAGMFTVRGSGEARYNAGARPVFDPVTGLFFYVGIVIALRRLRHAAHALLLVWLAAALLPTLLANDAPSFWRAGGALFPILALPGIGLDWLWQRLAQRRPKLASPPAWPGAVLATAVVLAGATSSVMFGPWRTSPEVMRTYESDLYLAARYLDENPPPAGTDVVVAAAYAADSAQVIFGLQSRSRPTIHWTTAFMWPAGGGEVWYLFSQESMPTAQTRAWLGAPPDYRATNSVGEAVLEVYRLAAPPGRPRFDRPLARFGERVELLGVMYPQALARGAVAEALLFWRVGPDLAVDPSNPPYFRVRLVDQDLVWAEAGGLLAYPRGSSTPGDVWVQPVAFDVPADMPPQELVPELVLFSGDDRWPAQIDLDADVRTQIPLPPIQIVGHPSHPPPPEAARRPGPGLALVEASVTPSSAPGELVYVKTTWQALAGMDEAYRLEWRLLNSAGQLVAAAAQPLGGSRYPTSEWQPGERVTFNDPVRAPVDAASGDYLLQLRVLGAAGNALGDGEWLPVGRVILAGRARVFDAPPVDAPLDAQFGDVARLIGYTLQREASPASDLLRVTLVWQALRTPDVSLKVFLHLYGAEDDFTVYGQHDSLPAYGAAPTTGWLLGEYIQDEHVLPLDPNWPPGDYRLAVGLYDEPTLQRLTVLAGGAVSDALIVTRLRLP
jgi:4-amino-4-deoxy-L-arabinose transferase-like glycosyltransferase